MAAEGNALEHAAVGGVETRRGRAINLVPARHVRIGWVPPRERDTVRTDAKHAEVARHVGRQSVGRLIRVEERADVLSSRANPDVVRSVAVEVGHVVVRAGARRRAAPKDA